MTEYIEKAQEFLKETNTTLIIEYETTVDGFPNSDDTLPHRKYNVTLIRDGKRFSFPFYGSYNDWKEKKDPDAYDVLACLQTYEPEKNMWDFASEFGYVINSEKSYRNVKKIHAAVWNEYNGLRSLFNNEQLERLGEIS